MSREQGAFSTTEIGLGVYARRGVDEIATPHNFNAIANLGFIVGDDCVAVVDPGGCLADGEQLRQHIREVTKRPIRYVLLSHVHPDHIFGAGAFLQDKPVFVGHALLPQALAERGEYYRERLEEALGRGAAGPIVEPTMLVRERATLDLGGRTLEVQAYGLAHTSNDLSAFDSKTRILFASDLIFAGRAPSLDGSVRGWLKALERLAAVNAMAVVPGHGPTRLEWASAVADLRRYLTTLLRETRQAIAEGVDISEAPETVGRQERDKWLLFDEYHAHNVTRAYQELEWE
jgi:quinoprotein relay system zinc metallohydrolase 2